MVIYGYATNYMYTGTGNLMVQVRIPNIHGPLHLEDYQGQKVRNYTPDSELPWYPSLLLPHMPNTNDVVALMATNDANTDFLVLGLTGGQYTPISTD